MKGLNLLKKAHTEFVRYGGSLEAKYDNVIDNHYVAVNYGESHGEFNIHFRSKVL